MAVASWLLQPPAQKAAAASLLLPCDCSQRQVEKVDNQQVIVSEWLA
jgi:hypothetical protein